MRWILVFIFLYLIPLVILFRNYKNKKRSLVYSSIYVVLMTLIVISNIYMSGLKRIEESMEKYRAVEVQVNNNGMIDYSSVDSIDRDNNYKVDNSKEDSLEEESSNSDKEVYKKSELKNNDSLDSDDFDDEIDDDLDDDSEESSKFVVNTDKNTAIEANKNISSESKQNLSSSNKNKVDKKIKKIRQSDLEKINGFRKEVFSVEKTALVSMQKCLPYTKNVASSLSNIKTVKKDITDARDKCKELAEFYRKMDIPNLSENKYERELKSAKLDMQKTYELREKSMDNALKLVDSKNPKYIAKVTDYLDSSDKKVKKFSERVNDLIYKIEDEIKDR
ncbi:hypothetical protein [Metaclostridioides mangenotii]|uniref:hypothetical protein n=1 Tax=Metaclostridioides mangenotii TaxID=1540 RepID=UPI00047F7E76|nr:hypothetical protein [Clostridioides mangenotii]